jgi:hypothetical protein
MMPLRRDPVAAMIRAGEEAAVCVHAIKQPVAKAAAPAFAAALGVAGILN